MKAIQAVIIQVMLISHHTTYTANNAVIETGVQDGMIHLENFLNSMQTVLMLVMDGVDMLLTQ